jgi:hypothetical protein
VQQSISSGNEAQLQQELVSINAALASVGSIDKTTEQLLLTYNIPDTEVNYQNRGK